MKKKPIHKLKQMRQVVTYLEKHALVASIKQTPGGSWRVKPPYQVQDLVFNEYQEAINYIVSQGWGVHLTRG